MQVTWAPPQSSMLTWLQETERAKALAILLVIHFHPATQDRSRLRQCLSVFFPTYAMASSSNKHDIAGAFRRAARGTLRAGPLKKSPAPQLMRYMLHLLHLTPASKDDTPDADADVSAAEQHPGSRYAFSSLALVDILLRLNTLLCEHAVCQMTSFNPYHSCIAVNRGAAVGML